jgi:hypothetical protein
MKHVTDADVAAAILKHVTTLIGPDERRYCFGKLRLSFDNPQPLYTHAEVSEIVRACLALDMPVTDVPYADAWLAMMTRLASLEDQVERLARGEHSGRLL